MNLKRISKMEVVDEVVRVWTDYPRLSYKEAISIAIKMMDDNKLKGDEFKMADLRRFENQYTIQFDEIKNGDTVAEINLTRDDIMSGVLVEEFEEREIRVISDTRVYVGNGGYINDYRDYREPIECRVFVNGRVVSNIREELGIR